MHQLRGLHESGWNGLFMIKTWSFGKHPKVIRVTVKPYFSEQP